MAVFARGKEINFSKLWNELIAAGITFNQLGRIGDRIVTYTATGSITDLPDRAQAVIDAHNAGSPAPSLSEDQLRERAAQELQSGNMTVKDVLVRYLRRL